MKITLHNEYDISDLCHRQITQLRNLSFPDNKLNRSYFKQLPHSRFLVRDNDNLIAHMGIDHRMISVGESNVSIFGVIDLCVDPLFRSKGIATLLLTTLSNMAKDKEVDFLFLLARNPMLYEGNGFHRVSVACSWLKIDEHVNFGVATQRLDNEVMVKQIGDVSWPDGLVDLLGYMF